jgi:AcrR family transcriptional regulator
LHTRGCCGSRLRATLEALIVSSKIGGGRDDVWIGSQKRIAGSRHSIFSIHTAVISFYGAPNVHTVRAEKAVGSVRRDPDGTRKRIIDAATEQFSTLGLAGARVEAIASAACTNERMLYYYYTNKEGLYVAVLESMYEKFAARERSLDLTGLTPSQAICSIAESIWTFLRENPRWLNILNGENLHRGLFLKRSDRRKQMLSPIVDQIRHVILLGVESGEFRNNVDPLDFYVSLVGLGYFVISNRFTLDTFLGRNYQEKEVYDSIAAMHFDMLLAYLRSPITVRSLSSEDAAGRARAVISV